MIDLESIIDFFSKASRIVNQMRCENIKDYSLEKVLRSLFPNFDMISISIEEAKYKSILCIDELMGFLLVH